MTTQKNYKIGGELQADSFYIGNYRQGCDMQYTIDGKVYTISGEFYYNKRKQRFEHEHWFDDEGEKTLTIYWPHEF